jgi:hypothetical protein
MKPNPRKEVCGLALQKMHCVLLFRETEWFLLEYRHKGPCNLRR